MPKLKCYAYGSLAILKFSKDKDVLRPKGRYVAHFHSFNTWIDKILVLLQT